MDFGQLAGCPARWAAGAPAEELVVRALVEPARRLGGVGALHEEAIVRAPEVVVDVVGGVARPLDHRAGGGRVVDVLEHQAEVGRPEQGRKCLLVKGAREAARPYLAVRLKLTYCARGGAHECEKGALWRVSRERAGGTPLSGALALLASHAQPAHRQMFRPLPVNGGIVEPRHSLQVEQRHRRADGLQTLDILRNLRVDAHPALHVGRVVILGHRVAVYALSRVVMVRDAPADAVDIQAAGRIDWCRGRVRCGTLAADVRDRGHAQRRLEEPIGRVHRAAPQQEADRHD
eukprot:7031739-Prymnesium_polylepis.1